MPLLQHLDYFCRKSTSYYYSSAVPITLEGSQAKACNEGPFWWAWGLPKELGVVPLWCTSDTGTFTVPASVTPGQYRVVLVARGEKAYGAWPTLAFRLNGAQQFTRSIDQVVYREYDLGTYPLAAGHTLSFEFTNDACECSPYTDRNAFLAEVRLEPVNQGERVVTVMQGSGSERKETNYHFDAQGQLVKRRVWDYNPWAAGASGWFGHSPREKVLEWTYSYYGSGATASVTDPAGKKTTYGYDMLGNLTLQEVWVGGTLIRSKVYSYNGDNRVLQEITPARAGEGYNYGDVHVNSTYTYHPTVAVGGQTFRAVSAVETSTHVNEPGVGWQWKRSTVSSYDTYGRLTESRRKANGQPDQTTTYTYHTYNLLNVAFPTASGEGGSTRPVRHYGDQVDGVNVEGNWRWTWYDELGNPASETHSGAFVADFSGSSPVFRARRVNRSYNGFGQMVWERIAEDDGASGKPVSLRMSRYYATGELDHGWEGRPENVTDYAYASSGANVGRLSSVLKGVGSNGSVGTAHESTGYSYDAYGRVTSKTVDGFTYTTRYDTLDRAVEEVLPDGGWQVYTYSRSGTPDFECSGAAGARIDSAHCQYKTVDALGRVTSVLHAVNQGGTNQAGMTAFTVGTAYDPFDRPVRVENNALTMNAGGAERTTYFVYDSLGNLIKQLDPPLRTNPSADAGGAEPGYTDGRRPYVEYSYDSLGRRTQERRLLAGDVTPAAVYGNLYGSFAACGSSAVACTGTAYDALDRPVTVTDPEGYATTLAYDPAGNLVGKTQQVWTGGEPDYATLGSGFTSVTTRYAYDGAGRVTKTVTPRGHAKRVVYDLLGNVREEWDERGVLVRQYGYTEDGLLLYVYEPDNDPATSASTPGPGGYGGYVLTKRLEYGSRKYPTKTCVASMDADAWGGACTTHYYDYAGRVLTNVLPDGSIVNMSYDSRGHQTYLKDAEGFETEYTHDAWGNLVREFKKSRGNQTDADAGFPAGGGVLTEYWYDYAGNLVKQRTNASPTRSDTGLYTEYAYNSLGKVMRETRPHRAGVGTNARLKTYRLDAQVTAETTYDYAGDLTSASKAAGVSLGNMPSVTAGNATVMEYNRRGEKVREASQAKPLSVGSTVLWNGREHTATFQYNGLGLKVKRVFAGSTRVYATQRDANGYALGTANYNSYWKYDANSKLIEYWDTPASSSGDGTPLNASDKQNRYTYQYSPTNKETRHTRDVRFKVRSYYNTPNHDFSNGALMAATVGSATTAYNERDQVNNVSFTDQAPQDWSATGKATSNIVTYWYHKDGSKKKAQTGDGHYTQYSYDSRGRVVSVYDSNGGVNNTGNTVIPAGATTATAYASDGTQTQEVKNGSTLLRISEDSSHAFRRKPSR